MSLGSLTGMGATAAVWHEGRIVWKGATGYVAHASGNLTKPDFVPSKPTENDTIFRLASVSKPITAVMALMLAEEGKVNLDAPLSTYLSELEDKPGAIVAPPEAYGRRTIRQILTHTAGFGHYSDYPSSFNTWSRGAQVKTAREAISRIVERTPIGSGGQKYHYSTHSFTVLAAALESADQRDFPRIAAKAFTKAGTTEIALVDPPVKSEVWAARQPRRSKLFRTVNFEDTDLENVSWKWAGGGMEGTAEGLAQFWGAVLSGRVLNRPSVNLLFNPGVEASKSRTLGFASFDTAIEHGGSQEGTSSYLLISRDRRTVVAVLTNTRGLHPRPQNVARKIGSYWNSSIWPASNP